MCKLISCFYYLENIYYSCLLCTISEPATIIAPAANSRDLIDREKIASEEVVFGCDYQGFPTPDVTWYYNGIILFSTSDEPGLSLSDTEIPHGINITGTKLLEILDSQVNHSGIYQCIVSNVHQEMQSIQSRSWILEIRAPS